MPKKIKRKTITVDRKDPKKALVVHQDARGRFIKGNKAAAGSQGPISGRTQALRALDEILSKSANLKVLQLALQTELRKDPLWFFRRIVMPLIPKEQLLHVEGGMDMGANILEALREELRK